MVLQHDNKPYFVFMLFINIRYCDGTEQFSGIGYNANDDGNYYQHGAFISRKQEDCRRISVQDVIISKVRETSLKRGLEVRTIDNIHAYAKMF